MYLFFMICGFLFVAFSSIVLENIFLFFSVNKITNFLNPTSNTIFNNIGISLVPNIIWSFIEVPVLGYNFFFWLGFVLNIFITLCITYIFIYGYSIISDKNILFVKSFASIFSPLFGFFCNYICLLIGLSHKINILYSIIFIILFTLFYFIIKIFPPKSYFFRGNLR